MVIVTADANDFVSLLSRVHPRLIILPNTNCEYCKTNFKIAISFLREMGEPMDLMLNHVLTINSNGVVTYKEIPLRGTLETD